MYSSITISGKLKLYLSTFALTQLANYINYPHVLKATLFSDAASRVRVTLLEFSCCTVCSDFMPDLPVDATESIVTKYGQPVAFNGCITECQAFMQGILGGKYHPRKDYEGTIFSFPP